MKASIKIKGEYYEDTLKGERQSDEYELTVSQGPDDAHWIDMCINKTRTEDDDYGIAFEIRLLDMAHLLLPFMAKMGFFEFTANTIDATKVETKLIEKSYPQE